MKKIWEVIKAGIKKILMWLGAVFMAIFTVLFVKECQENKTSEPDLNKLLKEQEEINAQACKKRKEAINRIHNADARTVAEGYSSVCDTIADGKERFRKRCKRTDD